MGVGGKSGRDLIHISMEIYLLLYALVSCLIEDSKCRSGLYITFLPLDSLNPRAAVKNFVMQLLVRLRPC